MKSKLPTLLLLMAVITMLVLLLSGCMTAEKAKGYLANHRDEAAKFCDAQFPTVATTETKVVEDTAGSNLVKKSLNDYKDSVLKKSAEKNDSIEKMRIEIEHLHFTGFISQATADVLQAQLRGIKPTDTEALRKSIEAKIRATIIPCKDSIIEHNTGISTAKYEVATLRGDRLQGETDAATDSRNKWRKWCLITWGIIAAYIALRFFTAKLGLIGKFIK